MSSFVMLRGFSVLSDALTELSAYLDRKQITAAELIIVNADGRYLVHVPEFDQSLRLSARETMTRELARLLWERHGVSATHHFVLSGFDANGVACPSFHSRWNQRRTLAGEADLWRVDAGSFPSLCLAPR
jgi:hypothetical protein